MEHSQDIKVRVTTTKCANRIPLIMIIIIVIIILVVL
jgi:hypothetical protein